MKFLTLENGAVLNMEIVREIFEVENKDETVDILATLNPFKEHKIASGLTKEEADVLLDKLAAWLNGEGERPQISREQ